MNDLRHYETLWIASGALSQEEVDTLVSEMEGVVRNGKGNLTKSEKQGKRRLAYAIDGQRDGYYTLFELECDAAMIAELERKMRLHEHVLRYLSVNVDDENRRVEKLKTRRREKKEKKQRPEARSAGAATPAPTTTQEPSAAE